MRRKDTSMVSLLLGRIMFCGIILLWLGHPSVSDGKDRSDMIHQFPAVEELPDNAMMPDPFRKPDGTRVNGPAEWQQQRMYLRAMLEHYLYGRVPPKPAGNELSFARLSDEAWTSPNGPVKGRKQSYRITISRNGLDHSFGFILCRPGELRRYPCVIINNYPKQKRSDSGFRNAEALRRGYTIVEFWRTEVAPDKKGNANREKGIFLLYPEYDFRTIAAWAWAYQPVIDVLDTLRVVDMDKIVVTGHSRGGQTAMAAAIFDERIDLVAPCTGGPWSVGSYRQRDPKGYRGTMDYPGLIRRQFPHWYHPRYLDFEGRQNKLPWDAATLVALTAPRPLLHLNAVGDGINNGLAHEAGIRAGRLIYGWMGAEKWCRLHWRAHTNRYGQKGHDQGPEEFLAVFDLVVTSGARLRR